jgi:hypothetical protein
MLFRLSFSDFSPLWTVLRNSELSAMEQFYNFNTCCMQAVSGVHEAATDCVCALLQCLEDNNNQQALELQLFSGVMSLEEGFHLSVAHEDQEK